MIVRSFCGARHRFWAVRRGLGGADNPTDSVLCFYTMNKGTIVGAERTGRVEATIPLQKAVPVSSQCVATGTKLAAAIHGLAILSSDIAKDS